MHNTILRDDAKELLIAIEASSEWKKNQFWTSQDVSMTAHA